MIEIVFCLAALAHYNGFRFPGFHELGRRYKIILSGGMDEKMAWIKDWFYRGQRSAGFRYRGCLF
jgi:hypothetical protein